MIKNLIINRINKIKSDEENFKSYWWKDIFVSYSIFVSKIALNGYITTNVAKKTKEHISEVNFNDNIIDEDLIRLFEYIILTRNEISIKRVDKQYFSEYKQKSNL